MTVEVVTSAAHRLPLSRFTSAVSNSASLQWCFGETWSGDESPGLRAPLAKVCHGFVSIIRILSSYPFLKASASNVVDKLKLSSCLSVLESTESTCRTECQVHAFKCLGYDGREIPSQ